MIFIYVYIHQYMHMNEIEAEDLISQSERENDKVLAQKGWGKNRKKKKKRGLRSVSFWTVILSPLVMKMSLLKETTFPPLSDRTWRRLHRQWYAVFDERYFLWSFTLITVDDNIADSTIWDVVEVFQLWSHRGGHMTSALYRRAESCWTVSTRNDSVTWKKRQVDEGVRRIVVLTIRSDSLRQSLQISRRSHSMCVQWSSKRDYFWQCFRLVLRIFT